MRLGRHLYSNGNCQRALAAAKTRRGAWLALDKQGQDMIKSSNKRVKLLEVGSNVRIPILHVDRAPSGPTSLVGVVPDVSSTGNTSRLGTQHGQIPTWFSHSDVTPYGSDLLLSPSAVPDVELSVGPRPDRRSDQPVLSVTTRHRAHLSAAVAISRDLGRAV